MNSAANFSYLKVVKLLLEKKAKIKAINNYRWIFLDFAIDSGYFKVIKFLLKNRANIKAATKEKCMLLFFSVNKNIWR